MEDSLKIFDFPYTCPDIDSKDFSISPFEEAKGFFVPVLAGSTTVSASTFAEFFEYAWENDDNKVL